MSSIGRVSKTGGGGRNWGLSGVPSEGATHLKQRKMQFSPQTMYLSDETVSFVFNLVSQMHFYLRSFKLYSFT